MKNPSVIAFGYYDGALEGLARSVLLGDYCYFKVIAWDDDQVERLYAVVRISSEAYLGISTLLEKIQSIPSVETWIPSWEFSSEEDRCEAEAMLRGFQADVLRRGVLLLAEGIGKGEKLSAFVTEAVVELVEGALLREYPGNISEWKGLLERLADKPH